MSKRKQPNIPGNGPSIAQDAPASRFRDRIVEFRRERLTVPILPFSEIDRRGAGMYRGNPRVRSADSGTSGNQPGSGGAIPTRTLYTQRPMGPIFAKEATSG